MSNRCDGLTFGKKFSCTQEATWAITVPDARQGNDVIWSACGQHLNQVSDFLTRNDDVSQPATRLEVKRVR